MSGTALGESNPIALSESVHAQAPLTDTTPYRRGMVFVRAGGGKVPLARLTLVADVEGRGHVQIEGESREEIEKICKITERLSQTTLSSGTAGDDLRLRKWIRLVEALENEGLEVNDLPDGDHEIKFELDIRSGRGIGSVRNLHDFAAPNDSLTRKIVRSLADAMKKIPDELAEKIEIAVASADPETILAAIRQGRESGAFSFHPTHRLLASLISFDITEFEPADRWIVQELRLAIAHGLNRYDIAGANAEALLQQNTGQLDDSSRAALEMVVASNSIRQGHTETALHIWRKLLHSPTLLDTPNRAWAWRNLALALPRESAEARHAAKCSADAFLEAGERVEAGKSLMRLAECQMLDEPARGLETLNEIIALMGDASLQGRHMRAAALHARGMRLARVGRHAKALEDAREAIALLRGLMGVEEALISSLHLAAREAGILGDADTAGALTQEAENLTNEINSSHFKMTRRVVGLAESFDEAVARYLRQEAEAADFVDIAAGVRVLQATYDITLSDMERLSLLEGTLQYLDKSGATEAAKQPTHLALAGELLRLGQSERAEVWYQKVLDADPFNKFARDSLVQSLWRREKWGDAAIVITRQIKLHGAMPGLLIAYGRSLFEAGQFSPAVSALTQAIEKGVHDAGLKKFALDMRERALRKGGTFVSAPKETTTSAVTSEEFGAALEQFARFIASEKRMTFWGKAEDSNYTWIGRPEQHAQNLLHTFLKARFLERVNMFDELASGAGRLDLYIQLYGGMSLILELKICGFGYSSSYAAAGEGQILHYMENRQSHLGYLVVFDARLDDFGRELMNTTGPHTVVSKFVDVRPRVSKRRRN